VEYKFAGKEKPLKSKFRSPRLEGVKYLVILKRARGGWGMVQV
jgi:hypothetical protein